MIAARLALLAIAAAPRAGQEPPRDVAGDVARVLCAPSARGASAELAALGAAAAPVLVEARLSGELPPVGAGPRGPLPAGAIELLDAALSALPSGAVRSALVKRVRPEDEQERRNAALELLARHGESKDAGLLVSLAAPPPRSGAEPLDGGRVQAAAGELLARVPAAAPEIAAAVRAAPADLRPRLVIALGEGRSAEGVEALGGLLGDDPELDSLVLAALGRAAAGASAPFDEATRRAVRGVLSRERSGLRREAAICAGRLEDAEAIPLLAELLGEEDAGLRDAAHWALRRISGLALPADARRWSSWHSTELAWWTLSADGALEALESEDPASVRVGLTSLAGRRLWRHELAAAVRPVLSDGDSALRALACQVLGGLGSRTSAPELAAAREDSDELVRAAAEAALAALDRAPRPARKKSSPRPPEVMR